MKALLVLAMVEAGAAAAPAPWVARCEAHLRDARLDYQSTIHDDFPRWDFGEWDWRVDAAAIRVFYTWRDFDVELAVVPSGGASHRWRARLVHRKPGDMWTAERVAGGRVASLRVEGAGALRDRENLRRVFQPALDACLK